ncbi:hypothetical protein [Cohnella luojiensis]|uniref:MarR family transcriptional regulator n=1 Tax=Cohnella luojiensis TaxID=652876 RepID=A0A4Y8MB45_9BACL|nr:hypothetical protein [Cohnella luojiensis]TFE30853.1 hypothetical protein E2980_03495 [Cohnella luojiensis]
MLDDTSRKLLRILDSHSYVPAIAELARKAGRKQWQIKKALKDLADKDHIDYDPNRHHELKVVLAWEIDPIIPQQTLKWWEHD